MYAELEQKQCTKCTLWKTVSEFSKDKNRKDGLFPWCKVCKSIGDAKTYTKNPDRIKANTKEWKRKNPDKKRKLNAGYKKRNPEKVNANTRKYKARNRGVTNANTAKRRAALLLRTPAWLTKQQLEEIQLFYLAAEYIQDHTGVEMHVDHMFPLQGDNISGLHVPWNLQLLTAAQNSAKKNKF